MRAVVQRVTEASVTIDGRVAGEIGPGVVVLLGIREGDTEAEAKWLADKVAHLRIFPDAAGKFDRSLLDIGGSALVVSQFTLYGDARKGRRPDFTQAARPDVAAPLIARFVEYLQAAGVPTASGEFQAMMLVKIFNDGPVTIILEK
ncbi:MAG: D-tyrosyl-tRNA(Tyr) deacylase [Chloroflexi bacterium RBG_16_57_9]|nr:MAG: D-tyrosyl-tRNA(Tyr) deacylase [Chloroflexi bacterium RBG_16_57_9]